MRLAADETWFGSHANLYDSRDTDLVAKGRDGAGNAIMQRAHVHEVGHLLGLGHVAIGQPGCPPSGDTNISACYGVTDADKNSVMGGGMRRDKVHGKAWNDAFEAFVGEQPRSALYTPPPAKVRPAMVTMNRIYPRTIAEFEAGAVLTTLAPGR
ncbi:hypothetical protein [Sphingomonas sp. CFBP 8760]|uniref:hypothetical protein n=1 Tax=Sphingomonas sp. CFBP 8760 TaxID=2775282 RepID=UPI00177BF2DF|nr:hypothetical protein [Sphingomonas sp. CFBP 8760]MBD8546287.1 hypothetical protein [Sphingomonas sp. CFBP 8760]